MLNFRNPGWSGTPSLILLKVIHIRMEPDLALRLNQSEMTLSMGAIETIRQKVMDQHAKMGNKQIGTL